MSGTELEIPQTMDANPAPEDEHQEGERQLSPREIAMQSIVRRAEEQREAELAQAAIYDADAREAGLTLPDDELDAPVEAQPPAPQPHRTAAPVAQPAPVAAPVVRTVEVDGREYQVTDSQLVELARLGMVANVALHQYQHAPQQQPAAPQHPPAPIVDENMIRETVRRIQYDGEDGGTEALAGLVNSLMARVPTQQVDQNAIVQQAVSESRRQAQLAADSDRIRQEYPDIFADPQRTLLAKLNVDAIRDRDMRMGRNRPDIDIYREAGDAVYTALGKSRPGSDTTQPALQAAQQNVVPIRQDVIERKRAAPRATQAIDMRAPAPTATRPPSGSDIVEQMRRARGQASMR